jgi:hypothetical protein
LTNQETWLNPSLWNRIDCTCLGECTCGAVYRRDVLSGTVPHLVFSLEIQSNKLVFEGNPYTERQIKLHSLIVRLQNRGLGYRRIAKKLNAYGIKTTRGKSWYNTSVSSMLKKKSQRDARYTELRNREYPIKIGKFSLKYYTY